MAISRVTTDMHLAMLAEIRQKRAALDRELRTLEEVERYHKGQIGRDAPECQTEGPPADSQTEASTDTDECEETSEAVCDRDLPRRLFGTKKHDAARIALEYLGRPAKVGDLIGLLRRSGYGTDLQRRILHNSLHTAMARKPDMFSRTETASGVLWELIPPNEE